MNNHDKDNSEFWNEPCGTLAANNLGFDLEDPSDLALFDQWYWEFYPYLKSLVDTNIVGAKSVLEIGVGAGTVSRYLSTKEIDLHLLDVAPESLRFVESTITNRTVSCLNQSVLDVRNIKESFDCILAIGSLHHTGDLELALNNAESLLNPGGKILVMIYYAWQPRRILKHPFKSSKEFLSSLRFLKNPRFIFEETDENIRKASDVNSIGEAAPNTAYASRNLFNNRKGVLYSSVLMNSHHIGFKHLTFIPRHLALKMIAPIFGCDIYASGALR
jgi:SAM-dependent methyltransferase